MDNELIIITNVKNIFDNFFEKIEFENKKIYFINNNDNINNNIIKIVSPEQNIFLQNNINYSSKCLLKLDNELKNFNNNFNNNIWKICIFENMFFNLPFTLEDIIFIPLKYLNSCLTEKSDKHFSKTLIHEKIHLLQRHNQENWIKYIIKNTKWIVNNNEKISKITLIRNNKIIYNPDTYYNNNFLYFLNNKYYYAEMLLNSKNEITNIWFEAIINNNKIYLHPTNLSITKYEHPFEELAYNLSNKLIN